MKKILLFIFAVILNINLSAFSLSDLEFNEALKKGEKKNKEYTITNNSSVSKIYKIESESKYKNIKVYPEKITLLPNQKKDFKITVIGKGELNENSYYLVITETVLKKDGSKKNPLYLNKIVKIKQKYMITN